MNCSVFDLTNCRLRCRLRVHSPDDLIFDTRARMCSVYVCSPQSTTSQLVFFVAAEMK